ncbi:diacylglycerol/lipid kinase family protein [Ligilactobacillus ceti]|uniref:Transcription regulator n=1 Tax=Ligilactobacillus ceti DSM 22408 TaxID=1122146 RepID=A0A0R2KI15_9LACO|nr:diacylglycerol kinase family protein [Ligilactobacillus ceti]KRN88936.1 transcription regulator [Ligilactobacillus ceti DSM 22408]
MRSYSIIVNEHANEGHTKKIWNQVQDVLNQRQIQYTAYFTDHPGHAFKIAKKIAKKITSNDNYENIILTIGGDGTLYDAINGIKAGSDLNIPIGFIPSGNKMGFAANIGVANDPLLALEQILNTTEPTLYDIGSYQETTHKKQGYFLNNFSIGLDAYIISLANQQKQSKFWKFLKIDFIHFLFRTFEAYLNQEAFSLTVRMDDHYEFFKKAYLVNVSNHRYFKGSLPLPTEDLIQDQQLELLIIENMNFFKYILLSMIVYFRKELKLPSIHRFQKNQLHLTINSLEFYQVDGEEQGNQYLDIYFKTEKYPFWIDLTSVPREQRAKKD